MFSIFQGTVYDIRYPFIILTVMYLIGTIIAMFVPETLHQKLPDTLEEAKVFGIGQVRIILEKTFIQNYYFCIFRNSGAFLKIQIKLHQLISLLMLLFLLHFFQLPMSSAVIDIQAK